MSKIITFWAALEHLEYRSCCLRVSYRIENQDGFLSKTVIRWFLKSDWQFSILIKPKKSIEILINILHTHSSKTINKSLQRKDHYLIKERSQYLIYPHNNRILTSEYCPLLHSGDTKDSRHKIKIY